MTSYAQGAHDDKGRTRALAPKRQLSYRPAMISGHTVIALGGHSLLDPSLPPSVENQFAVTQRAMTPICDLIESGARVVLTHGNGPQVGFMQLRSELARGTLHEVPLDSLVANTQGSLGYMIQRALREELRARGLHSTVATIVTEVEVDPEDTAFEDPTKPIGRFYSKEESDALAEVHGWKMRWDAGRAGYRRVVPSPNPVGIVQLDIIRQLLSAGDTVVCCGGGGVPIVRHDGDQIRGLEAVIDKDRVSARLAVELKAPRLVITTGIDAVYRDFGSPQQTRLAELNVEEVRALAREGQFPSGSMRPKMEAAIFYLNRRPGGECVICRPEELIDALTGKTGTILRKESS